LQKKIGTAEARLDREKGQSQTSLISAASSIAGALFGSFLGGRRTRMTTVARGVGYASQQGRDVQHAEAALRLLKDDRKKELRESLEADLDALNSKYDSENIELETTEIRPRKSDLKVADPMVVWTPWQVDSVGIASPLY
jgi:hypothetical protein